MTLTVIRSDGSKRAITVRPDPGLVLPESADREAGWFVDEQIKFVAFDPVWYDPAQNVKLIAVAAQQNLVFPITFPIQFGTNGLLYTTTITYTGSWYEWPTITLVGPYDSATITNVTTGVTIYLTVPLASGNTRIFNTRPGQISVTDAAGNNYFSEVGPSSDIVDFNLRPAPEVAGGQNVINVVLLHGTNGVSSTTFSYYNRYLAI
jgi:hypothetical protein